MRMLNSYAIINPIKILIISYIRKFLFIFFYPFFSLILKYVNNYILNNFFLQFIDIRISLLQLNHLARKTISEIRKTQE